MGRRARAVLEMRRVRGRCPHRGEPRFPRDIFGQMKLDLALWEMEN